MLHMMRNCDSMCNMTDGRILLKHVPTQGYIPSCYSKAQYKQF